MRRKAKVDDNQQQVVKMLRRIPGLSVRVTSMLGDGFPDLVLGYKNKNYLIELKDGQKTESRRKLTSDEIRFMEKWSGQYSVCKDLDEIMEVIGADIFFAHK